MKGRDKLGALRVDGRIILKWILNKYGLRVLTGFNWFKLMSSGELS
jgi:hypothetical protein